jgi:nicotinamidase-related amidase
MLADRARCQLLVVDMQERLLPAMPDAAVTVEGCRRLLAAASGLGVPARLSEQYVKGLGPTDPALRALVEPVAIFEKLSFSCLGQPELAATLMDPVRPQVVLCGTETHVCVLQTAADLLDAGRDVFIAADAVASRESEAKALALDRLRVLGAQVVTVEMVIFEWLGEAGTPEFRALSPLVRTLARDAAGRA